MRQKAENKHIVFFLPWHTGSGPNPLQNTGNCMEAKCGSQDKNNIMKQLTYMDLDHTRKEMGSFVHSEQHINN